MKEDKNIEDLSEFGEFNTTEYNKFKKVKDVKKTKQFNFDLEQYKSIIYTFIFYCCGMVIGAYFYNVSSSSTLDNMLDAKQDTLTNLFLSNVCVYFSMFLIVVFLGFCLIGFPIVNIIPAVIGVQIGLKAAYFYINYSTKGIGYLLIMIAPFVSLFVVILSFTIKISTHLSKSLIELSKENSQTKSIDVKPYLKKYTLYGLCIIATAFADALVITLLCTIITI